MGDKYKLTVEDLVKKLRVVATLQACDDVQQWSVLKASNLVLGIWEVSIKAIANHFVLILPLYGI